MKTTLYIIFSVLLSAYIGYSDLHQTDTGVTVAVLLLVSFIIGILVEKRVWVYGLILGLGIPVWELLAWLNHWTVRFVERGQVVYKPATLYGNWSVAAFSLVLALFGVYTGWSVKKWLKPIKVS